MNRTWIIAEAGVNHNGSIEMAKQLIEAAAEAGADAVKFQTFKSENLVSKHAQKAKYQLETTSHSESQLEMLKKLELTVADHRELIDHCVKYEIQFLSTPFDSDSLRLLAEDFGIQKLKIPSGEVVNGPFLLEAARTKKPIILSTGMSSLAEVEDALKVLAFGYTHANENPTQHDLFETYLSQNGQDALKEKVTLLHCTTEYPTPYQEVNLKAMDTLKAAFSLSVGYSDHTEGIAIPIAAVARGATVIEKHFTLDKTLPGPDHKASLEPEQLAQMVRSIREIEVALGVPTKTPVRSELENMKVVRKSLVATRPIREGECFSPENLGMKRPGVGISPMRYWEFLGKVATRNYDLDEVIL